MVRLQLQPLSEDPPHTILTTTTRARSWWCLCCSCGPRHRLGCLPTSRTSRSEDQNGSDEELGHFHDTKKGRNGETYRELYYESFEPSGLQDCGELLASLV